MTIFSNGPLLLFCFPNLLANSHLEHYKEEDSRKYCSSLTKSQEHKPWPMFWPLWIPSCLKLAFKRGSFTKIVYNLEKWIQHGTYSVEEIGNILTWLNPTSFDQNLGIYIGISFHCEYKRMVHINWLQYTAV